MAKAPVETEKKVEEQEDLIDKIEASTEQTENDTPVEEEPEREDATLALQKQVEALKKSETIQKNRAERFLQESERAQQLVKEHASEVEKVRREAVQSQAEAIDTALGAAKSEAESAKRDIKTAISNGDPDAQADAYERLATARANISQLETGKIELEARIKAPIEEKPVITEAPGLPKRIQGWLQKHPEYTTDPRKYDKLRALHWEVIDEGHDFDSDEYLESMEIKLGIRGVAEEPPAPPIQRNSIVSAPVSREAPSTPNNDRTSSSVKLSAAQREAARIAGISEKVYAENLSKINKMKANGTYELKGS